MPFSDQFLSILKEIPQVLCRWEIEMRRFKLDLLECPILHRLNYLHHRLLSARMMLDARLRIAGHWKFNLYLLDRRDSQQQLIRLVHPELLGAANRNK